MTNEEKTKVQEGIIMCLPPNPHGRLLLAPRLGKTKLVIGIIKRDKPKSILWVTPSAKLAKEDIPEEFAKWGAEEHLATLTTATWRGLKNIKGHFDLIVFDEDQHITESNTSGIMNGSITCKNCISMTGTPSKDRDKLKVYKLLRLKPLYELTINEAVKMGILADYKINVIHVPLDTSINLKAGSKDKPFMTSEMKNYQYLSKRVEKALIEKNKNSHFIINHRMRAIHNSPTKAEVSRVLVDKIFGRKLIFAPTIQQSNDLCVAQYNSKTDDTELKKFQNGEIDCIALVKSGGTGFTYKAIDHLVLTQADSDINGLTSQKITRTLLGQLGYKATIWIVCLDKTQDEVWIESTLDRFDDDKISHFQFSNLINKESWT